MSSVLQLYNQHMTDNQFKKLSLFVTNQLGIKMPGTKKLMLEARIRKRIKALDMGNYKEYVKYLFSEDGKNEIVYFFDAVTTNKTDFFREPEHFHFINEKILSNIKKRDFYQKPFLVWSAGCSTGEEPYTLSIILKEYSKQNTNFKFKILATDISHQALGKAERGIYKSERISKIPNHLKIKYFLKHKDKSQKLVKTQNIIRNSIYFHRLNLMSDDYNVLNMFDLIMCRNVLIYFAKLQQKKIVTNLSKHLLKHGLFIIGHSETLNGLGNINLKQIRPTIYQKI